MRMRRKKNLDAFVEMYPDILKILLPEEKNLNDILAKKEYLDLKQIFGDKEVQLEIGCGKGSFICELAKQNPDKAFLAVEVSKNVIVEACKKVREANLTNVLFLNCGAQNLPRYLAPNTISRIYLNFSCPFPKYTYASHRLTHENFLNSYKEYLMPDAEIHQKTDNMHFFEFSIEQFTKSGYKLKNISLDLHNSNFEGNIVTEYEHKFASQGMPIYRLEAYR